MEENLSEDVRSNSSDEMAKALESMLQNVIALYFMTIYSLSFIDSCGNLYPPVRFCPHGGLETSLCVLAVYSPAVSNDPIGVTIN